MSALVGSGSTLPQWLQTNDSFSSLLPERGDSSADPQMPQRLTIGVPSMVIVGLSSNKMLDCVFLISRTEAPSSIQPNPMSCETVQNYLSCATVTSSNLNEAAAASPPDADF